MKRSALNRAWVRRWKYVNRGKYSASLAIITPSCLSVDRAIIFFRSHSTRATDPAINIVSVAVSRSPECRWGIWLIEG